MDAAEKQRGKPFPKGVSGNPEGKKLGQRNYATIYREALIKIGETKGMTPEQVEDELHRVGLDAALAKHPVFYKDVMDRLHGKPEQKTDITSGGEKITGLVVEFAHKTEDNNTSGV